ncbi:MAG: PEP-CTERM/exosortase system-associated acyltransferase [Vicinamibacterales bacterium]
MESLDEIRAPLVGDTSPHFTGLVIDDSRPLLEESYRLRYQVYCLERRFLPPDDYPDALEIDAYDRRSVHVGVLNSMGEVAATARLIELCDAGLPALDHCQIYPEEKLLHEPGRRVVEVSRLSVSRRYTRRAGDGFYGLQGRTVRSDGRERRGGGELVMTLYKALYQASKRRGFTHWLAATEKSLQRLVAKYGFPFRAIGPETDYYGSVSPYLMDLREFDQVISSRRIALLDGFLDGLEPEFRPRQDLGCPPGQAA